MLTINDIIKLAHRRGKIRTMDIVSGFDVSRQYASKLISQLVTTGQLIKIGSTYSAIYVSPKYADQHPEIFPDRIVLLFKNQNLEEHRVIQEIEKKLPLLVKLPDNVQNIFKYAFSEMVNNAIEHSRSAKIKTDVSIKDKKLTFRVEDYGIGVFRNIMKTRKLNSELEAIQDLFKGKTTTMPKSHTGEGIFFTSKIANQFSLNSFGYQVEVDNLINDIFVGETDSLKKGTEVVFTVAIDTPRHLQNIFKQFTDPSSGYGFTKTEIKIKLYTISNIYISRSQARRILAGLDKFTSIIFDFDQISIIGQAFADEIFRVFHRQHPKIKLKTINANSAVQFMIDRAGSKKQS